MVTSQEDGTNPANHLIALDLIKAEKITSVLSAKPDFIELSISVLNSSLVRILFAKGQSVAISINWDIQYPHRSLNSLNILSSGSIFKPNSSSVRAKAIRMILTASMPLTSSAFS